MNSSDDSDYGSAHEDQYCDSDTSENIPDPNNSDFPLYQDVDLLPEELSVYHWEEGLIYGMTLIDEKT